MVVNGSYWAVLLSKRLGYTVSANEPYSLPNCTSTTNCVFPNGIIPQRAFSPAALGTLKFIPLPNSGANQYVTSGQNRKTVDDKDGPARGSADEAQRQLVRILHVRRRYGHKSA